MTISAAHAPLRFVNHLLTISTIYFMMLSAFFSAFPTMWGNHNSFEAAECNFFEIAAVLSLVAAGETEVRAEWFSINNAISQAVLTNPGVGEASADRRATEAELRQTQGTLLPQVRLESQLGPEKFDQQIIPPPIGNGKWLPGREFSVVVRQILFDGFASIHDIWRQSARVNAASFRVRERTELIALDAAEAYINIVRYRRLVALANQNIANHEELFSNVQSRYSGGRAGEGDLEQALERVEAAKAALAEFRRSLDDAYSKYRKVIGLEAANLTFPARFEAFHGRRTKLSPSRCTSILHLRQRNLTRKRQSRHFVSPMVRSSQPYRLRAAPRIVLMPIRSSAGAMTSPARSLSPGMFSAAARTAGAVPRWQNATPNKRCVTPGCNGTRWSGSIRPGPRERSRRTASLP